LIRQQAIEPDDLLHQETNWSRPEVR